MPGTAVCRKNRLASTAARGSGRRVGALLGAFVLSISVASCSISGTEVTPDPSSGETVDSSPASPSSEVTDEDEFSPEDFDWGEYPPKDFEDLRDLGDPVFPEAISTYTLESSSATLGMSNGSYIDLAAARPMDATVYDSPSNYKVILEGSQNVEYIGNVVCGNPKDAPHQLTCLTIGQVAVFVVRLPADVPMQEAAALTAEIYDVL